jgi:hypothetical protein
LRIDGAVFGSETRLLAVFRGFLVSYAASSGIIISSGPEMTPHFVVIYRISVQEENSGIRYKETLP